MLEVNFCVVMYCYALTTSLNKPYPILSYPKEYQLGINEYQLGINEYQIRINEYQHRINENLVNSSLILYILDILYIEYILHIPGSLMHL